MVRFDSNIIKFSINIVNVIFEHFYLDASSICTILALTLINY